MGAAVPVVGLGLQAVGVLGGSGKPKNNIPSNEALYKEAIKSLEYQEQLLNRRQSDTLKLIEDSQRFADLTFQRELALIDANERLSLGEIEKQRQQLNLQTSLEAFGLASESAQLTTEQALAKNQLRRGLTEGLAGQLLQSKLASGTYDTRSFQRELAALNDSASLTAGEVDRRIQASNIAQQAALRESGLNVGIDQLGQARAERGTQAFAAANQALTDVLAAVNQGANTTLGQQASRQLGGQQISDAVSANLLGTSTARSTADNQFASQLAQALLGDISARSQEAGASNQNTINDFLQRIGLAGAETERTLGDVGDRLNLAAQNAQSGLAVQAQQGAANDQLAQLALQELLRRSSINQQASALPDFYNQGIFALNNQADNIRSQTGINRQAAEAANFSGKAAASLEAIAAQAANRASLNSALSGIGGNLFGGGGSSGGGLDFGSLLGGLGGLFKQAYGYFGSQQQQPNTFNQSFPIYQSQQYIDPATSSFTGDSVQLPF